MKKENLIIALLSIGAFSFASCSMLPNKLVYPVDQADSKTGNTATSNPNQEVKQTKPVDKPEEAKPQPVENPEDKMETAAKTKRLPQGSLIRSFNLDYNQAWEKVLETMLTLPIISADKSGGVITTDWIVDSKAKNVEVVPIFGAAPSIERYRYVVKLYDMGGTTEVAVVQVAQRSGPHHWIDKVPATKVSANLMNKIISNLEN